MDSILKNWHNKGLHTADMVREKDSGQRRKITGPTAENGSSKPGIQKHGEPNREEIERMQRLLDKIKEEDEEDKK